MDNSTMLDVHILVMDYTPREIVNRCLSSVEEAASKSLQPVHIHVLNGVFGHLGSQRKRGYSCGTAPYVTYVDDDDWVTADAFAYLPLGDKPFAVSTSEKVHTGNHWHVSHKPHHLAVYQRKWLQAQPYERLKFFPDQFLLAQAQRTGTVTHVDMAVYNHVINQVSGSRRQRAESDTEEIEVERNIISSPELLYWEAMSFDRIALEIDKELNSGLG